MSAKRVEYHQGAMADVRSAVAWYQKRNPKVALDFVEELHRAADIIREAPERWPIGKNNTRRFLLWRFPFGRHLFRRTVRGHSLGGCPRQQATGVLGGSPLIDLPPEIAAQILGGRIIFHESRNGQWVALIAIERAENAPGRQVGSTLVWATRPAKILRLFRFQNKVLLVLDSVGAQRENPRHGIFGHRIVMKDDEEAP